ncbi:oxidoreductase [Pseudoclavibacter sp. RFBJ3]|uniref:mannitol dehydrogenase family protein n=1 Tax=unclassified Pseudoclavibacter TaxID=2615177 RepID=UPI000CE924A4|nr:MULTISPECIES: mannitol dehydrogenase family protein [unclassified Pseudoclavibacter]PPF80593.1 oxidoreductase [Pseudoclavibacter sp. RFBJ5]PPF90246.1 oxidoreductase [Pseudoclavibacter sp. RFBJ3]PPF94925.1 oxidoreductase [Pseudoclavibacter sp. RFBH5]PPG19052.1 oxidoreductase [Pseudoclavibacter sp. RFBI4]
MTAAAQPVQSLVRSEPAPPIRIVHLGLGAFSRSHTAWYTAQAADSSEWGISAYTGRSRELADALEEQDGLFTLVERRAEGDTASLVTSIVRARPGGDLDSLIADIARQETAIVTLTITEQGYRVRPDGRLDTSAADVAADLAALRSGDEIAPLSTAIGRLVAGLEERRRSAGGPLALISCDNVPDNGAVLRGAVIEMARVVPGLEDWCTEHVSFVSTSIDRITPRVEPQELERLRAEYGDRAPVVAEPFRDWVLEGEFPAGRPQWESAGARFTDELGPWESRKLWMLNGAHTLLASLGQLRGHRSVAQAIGDTVCRRAVEQLWDEAAHHLPAELDVVDYRRALLERFENPRIEHRLAQIAADSATKLRLRVVPVAELEREAQRSASGCAAAVAAWVAASARGLVPGLPGGEAGAQVAELVAALSERLAADAEFVDEVASKAIAYERGFTIGSKN